MTPLFPFGLRSSGFAPPVVVLDKSFLDATGSAQLQYYVSKGWTFIVPEALMYELLRKNDEGRTRSLRKLSRIEKSVVSLPGIGPMFQAEVREVKPASSVLQAKRVSLRRNFRMTQSERRDTVRRTAQLEGQLPDLIAVWRSLGSMPELKEAQPKEIPKVLADLKQQVRDDPEAIRQFYENVALGLPPNFPSPALIDERWAIFRWIQVYLVAGLDFFGSYGLGAQPNPDKLLHERIDLDYTIPALLVGGLACYEKRIRQRFKLLRPGGSLLPLKC